MSIRSDIDHPTVDVVIINYNSLAYLRDCIKSVIAYTTGAKLHFIIVDGGSSEYERAELGSYIDGLRDDCAVTYLLAPENRGFGSANNLALSYLRGEYVLLLNPDTLLTNEVVGRCVDWLKQHPDYGCVAARLLNADGSVQTSWYYLPTLITTFNEYYLRRWHYSFSRKEDGVIEVEGVTGACMAFPRGVAEQFVHFDEQFFMYMEEIDLCKRLRDQRLKIGILPEAVIIHYGGGSSPATLDRKLYYEMHRSRILYFRKHFGNFRREVATAMVKVGLFVNGLAEFAKSIFGQSSMNRALVRFGVAWQIARMP